MAPGNPLGTRGGGPGTGERMASLQRYWRRSYASDYVGIVIIMTLYLLIQLLVDPFHRMFSLGDLRISFPYTEVERVPMTNAIVYALVTPFVLILAVNWFTSAPAHKHHLSLLGLAVATAVSALVVDVIKNTVGRPRPDLIARCQPTTAADASRDHLVTISVCTETRQHRLQDGWRAFPSGHAALAFSGLGYLSLWLAGQTRIFAHGPSSEGGQRVLLPSPSPPSSSSSSASPLSRMPVTTAEGSMAETGRDRSPDQDRGGGGNEQRHYQQQQQQQPEPEHPHLEKLVRADLLPALLCLAPLVGAALIAISRLQDYRHDVFDVVTGGVLGFVAAYWSYRRYWPRLGSARCREPHGTVAGGGGGATGMKGAKSDLEQARGRRDDA